MMEYNPLKLIKLLSQHWLTGMMPVSQVEKVMKALHIRRLSLWPRFHSVIRDDLEKNPIEVCEVGIATHCFMWPIQHVKTRNRAILMCLLVVGNLARKGILSRLLFSCIKLADPLSSGG